MIGVNDVTSEVIRVVADYLDGDVAGVGIPKWHNSLVTNLNAYADRLEEYQAAQKKRIADELELAQGVMKLVKSGQNLAGMVNMEAFGADLSKWLTDQGWAKQSDPQSVAPTTTAVIQWERWSDVPMGYLLSCRDGAKLWKVHSGGYFKDTPSIKGGFVPAEKLDHPDYAPFDLVTK